MVVVAPGGKATAAAHGSGGCGKRAVAFFKMPGSCAGPQWAQLERRSRIQGRVQGGLTWRLSGFLPLVEAFGVGVERPGGGLGRATLRGQAQGLRTEGRVVRAALSRF